MEKTESQSVWNGNFVMLTIGQVISLFGNAILRFALPLYILEISGSPALFGTVLALSAIPLVIMSPIGGIVADRGNKKKIIVSLDAATAILILIYMWASGFMSIIPITVAIMMALFSIQAMIVPAVDASVPLLIPADKLVKANSVIFLNTSLSGILGPAIGGILFSRLGINPILIVSAVILALAAIMEMFIRIPKVQQEAAGNVFLTIRSDMSKGIAFMIKKEPIIAGITITLFFFQLSFAALRTIGIPVLVSQNLGMYEYRVGIAQGVMAGGGILGGVLVGAIGDKLRLQKAHWLLFSIGLPPMFIGLSFLLGAPAMIIYVIIITAFFVSTGLNTFFSIRVYSYIQSLPPADMVGKVVSIFIAFGMIGLPLGQFIFGMFFERFESQPWIAVFFAVIVSSLNALNSRRYFKAIK